MVQAELNYLAIGVGGLLHFGVGGLWYSPLLFANHWVKALGFTQEEMAEGRSKMAKVMGLTFLVSLVSSWILALLLATGQDASFLEMLKTVLAVWVGFIVAPQFLSILYERRSPLVALINMGYHAVALTAVGTLLVFWP